MGRTTELSICWADVCESTTLFGKYEDDRSRELVGPALRLIGDVFGDAVHIESRLVDRARADQIVTTT